jgi:Ala-tRNA(Pro) deacylase
MPLYRLIEFLDENHVKYVRILHSKAYTAREVAGSAYISAKEMAKCVVVFADGYMAMAVLPACERVDLNALREAMGAASVELASEEQFAERFPNCEVGAMPPFGNLFDMDVYVSPSLAEDERIAFNAGSHTELIQLAYEDFERLVQPRLLAFSATR